MSCHGLGHNMLQDVKLVVLTERNWLNLVVQRLSAKSNDVLWGTFDINSHKICISLNLSHYNLSFVCLAEW
jgi:hypothetical protein